MAENQPQGAHGSKRAPQAAQTVESPRDEIHQIVRVWWILVAHVFFCIAIALCMNLLLDGYKALDNAAGEPWEIGTKRYRLRVSEVTTILSAALVVVRICVSSWTAVTVWRCAFILMEEGHINLPQLNNMIDFRIPFSKPKSGKEWVVVSVILLLFPQPFIGPLVTGAVGWSTSLQWSERKELDNGHYGGSLDMGLATLFLNKSLIPDISTRYSSKEIDRLDWTALVLMPSVMKALPIKANGLVSIMWGVAGNSERETKSEPRPQKALCRQRVAIAPDELIPVKSIVYGSDLPCISVGEISWQEPSEPIRKMVETNGNFSIFGSRLQDYTMPGAAILFDPQQQTLTQMYSARKDGTVATNTSILPPLEFPTPETFTGSLSLLVLLDITPKCLVEALENTTIYGSVSTILPPQSILSDPKGLCYAYGTVEVTAGVVNFEKANFISSNTLENDAVSRNLSQADFKPEAWVKPAMVLLPDVMPRVASSNTSQIRTWDNLQGYAETLIHQSYLASWGVLRPFNSTQPTLYVSTAEPRLIATVNKYRLWGWFIISMFVPLSGVIWYFGVYRRGFTDQMIEPFLDLLKLKLKSLDSTNKTGEA